jgi:hypothetical protein
VHFGWFDLELRSIAEHNAKNSGRYTYRPELFVDRIDSHMRSDRNIFYANERYAHMDHNIMAQQLEGHTRQWLGDEIVSTIVGHAVSVMSIAGLANPRLCGGDVSKAVPRLPLA